MLRDRIIPPPFGASAEMMEVVTERDPHLSLPVPETSPLLSPVNGDLRDFPPTILISGTRDVLLSDTVPMHRALRAAGVEADLHVHDGQAHGDYLHNALRAVRSPGRATLARDPDSPRS